MNRHWFGSLLILICMSKSLAEPAIKETYMVPMRDGVKLATDVYRPSDAVKHPILLYRTYYNKNNSPLSNIVALLNFKGYICVIQDLRGRYASQGSDSVFITDGWGALQDGYDTIDWLSKQTWCNGKIGILGASADGICTYRTVASLHPALKCAVAIVAATDFYHQIVYPGGEYQKALCEGWLSNQGATWIINYYLNMPYYNDIWQNMNWHTRSNSIRIPMLHIGGWYDCFAQGTVAAFQDMKHQPLAAPQWLIMGPWTHYATGSSNKVGDLLYPESAFDLFTQIILWFDYWLLDSNNGAGSWPQVRYYLMGDPDKRDEMGCVWQEENDWPPHSVKMVNYYLSDGNLLSQQSDKSGQATFTYNPANPVPTVGGNNLNLPAGPFDQRTTTARSDVLTFISTELKQPVRMEGGAQGHLYVSSSTQDSDFTLKLIDVYPDGRQILVTDGIARLRFRNGYTAELDSLVTPGRIVTVEMSLPPTAIVFNSGHRVMVAISSSNYNRFEINPNSGQAVNDRSHPVIAQNIVYWGQAWNSHLSLPIIENTNWVAITSTNAIEFKLDPAFPNPFNSTTQFHYQLKKSDRIGAHIFNLHGQIVRTIVDSWQNAGDHHIRWDGTNEEGIALASGVYWLRVQAGTFAQNAKLVLIR